MLFPLSPLWLLFFEEISVSPLLGEMSIAVNVIGHYVLPWDWGNSPMKVRCAGRRRRGVGDMSVSATCTTDRNLVIRVDLADVDISGVDKVGKEGLSRLGKFLRLCIGC